jgi:BirA family biotin operon repressor/biotin-[acetyl-CoA-carboxylase] ligase
LYKILANTLFLGKEVIYVPSCHSTNELAAELLNNPATREGTVVITDFQTNGKGQRGNVWESEAKQNFIMSLILKPTFLRAKDQFALNMISSLAVGQAIDEMADFGNVLVKWPNDVLVNEKKVCGILIENSISGNFIGTSILGFGLNVNQKRIDYSRGTSLLIENDVIFDLELIFEKLLKKIEENYLTLKSGNLEVIKSNYMAKLFGYNVFRNYKSEYVFSGRIIDLDINGRLIIETTRGSKVFDFKEVEFLY